MMGDLQISTNTFYARRTILRGLEDVNLIAADIVEVAVRVHCYSTLFSFEMMECSFAVESILTWTSPRMTLMLSTRLWPPQILSMRL